MCTELNFWHVSPCAFKFPTKAYPSLWIFIIYHLAFKIDNLQIFIIRVAGRRGCHINARFLTFLQQEVENFKKVHLITREEFDCLTPEPPVDPNQEVPPGPPRPQQSKDTEKHKNK